MLIHKVPYLVQALMPQFTWRRKGEENAVYLTFDDGPVPGVTDQALEILEKYQVKATFFMVGDNVRKNPSLAAEVMAAGHAVGNHSFHHYNGFKVSTAKYLQDVEACSSVMQQYLNIRPRLFRPPYGRLTIAQAKAIRQHHDIIMWDVLSGDFSPKITAEVCVEKTLHHVSPGSIVVFHDQEKTRDKLPVFLEGVLSRLANLHLPSQSL